uniref:uncharacterized protein LOC122607113 n=1 Tax=Erigeron canadensis TaxID=72917 RepID=UPI001CB990A6|nr:uncharacterized protein LOC122607113 [Erigeron canadensis]
MSSSDEDSVSYIRKYTIDAEMLNTFVTLIDEEEKEAESSRMANRPKIPRRTVPRNHVEAAARLYNHYFAPQPVYPADYFRRHFQMPKEIFLRIVNDIHSFNAIQPLPKYFAFSHNAPTDAVGRPTLNIFQKCSSAIRQLAYASTADQLDEYLKMGSQTSADQFNTLFLQDKAPAVNFTLNGQQFTKGYYLADVIYPELATLVKSFKCPMDPKTSKFKRFQESARKDVERAFGVLQGRWRILQQGACPLSINKIKRIMYSCVLLYNMVVEYNECAISPLDLELIPDTPPARSWDERVDIHSRMTEELRDRATHNFLRLPIS